MRRKQNTFYRVFNNNIYYSNTLTAPKSGKKKKEEKRSRTHIIRSREYPPVLYTPRTKRLRVVLCTGQVAVQFTRSIDSSLGGVANDLTARSKMS